MDIDKINEYLSKLEGSGLIEALHIDSDSEIDVLKIKFLGSTGTVDIGEVELTFSNVEIINIPHGFMTPVKFRIGSEKDIK
jgi:hypothetical protein